MYSGKFVAKKKKEKKAVVKHNNKQKNRTAKSLCTFGTTSNPRYPLNIAKIEENKNVPGKTLANGLSKYVKSKPYLLSPIREKYNYFFHYLGYFW